MGASVEGVGVTDAIVLEPDLEQLADARRFVADVATAAGFSPDRVFDISVACSEATANAIEHVPVKGRVTIKTVLYHDRLEIQVHGPGEFQAPHRLDGQRAHRGLGLPLMAQFSDQLALYSVPGGGTLVSLLFYRPGCEPVAPEEPVPPAEHILTDRALQQREEACRTVLDSLEEGFCVIEVIFEEDDRPIDWRYLEINPGFVEQGGWPDAVGKRIRELVPDIEQRWLDFYGAVALTGVAGKLDWEVAGLGTAYHSRAFRVGPPEARTVGVLSYAAATDEVQKEADLQFIADVDRFLTGSLAAREIFPRVGEMLGAHLGVDNFVLAQTEAQSDWARSIYSWRDERAVGLLAKYPLSELNGPDYWQAMHSGVPFVVGDTASDERTHGPAHLEFGVAAFVVVPFGREGAWKYLVSVDSATPRAWSAREVELVKEVANRVVVRAERAWAEEDLRESEENYRMLAEENEHLYRQQLNIAETLQMALLNIPSEIGRVRMGHLYRSATEAAHVGGDFYDVFEAKDGSIAILMGDVAGHGIEAARTSTLVKDVVHAFTHQSLRTQEVLRRTNLLLIEKGLTEFVTLFLGILDPDTGSLRYSSAGHPESMLKKVSGGVQFLGCGTSPVGIYADASWRPHEISMDPGDLLLLYTDGVTEARRGSELFGEQRLARLLGRKNVTAGRLPHLILDQVLAFSGGSLRDDLAILAVAFAGPPAGATLKRPPAQQRLLD